MRVKWSQKLHDPVFNNILKEKFNCVASEAFSENGKYPVDRLKSNLMSLGVVGCGLGDTWIKNIDSPRENSSLSWLVKYCHEELDMPVIVKGILHPDDAITAVHTGADGIWVSNHGGRQVDGSISAIEALPGVYLSFKPYVSLL